MSRALSLLLIAFLAVATRASGEENPAPYFNLKASVTENAAEGPVEVQGTLSVENVQQSEQCFYLAYEDAEYPHHLPSLTRFINRAQQRTSSAFLRSGYTDMSLSHGADLQLEALSPEIVKITHKDGGSLENFTLRFKSSPKTINQKTQDLILFDYFYPMPLSSCDSDLSESTLSGRLAPARLDFEISYPPSYHFAGAGESQLAVNEGMKVRKGASNKQRFAFALLANSYQQQSFSVDGKTLHLLYRQQNVADLAEKAFELFAFMQATQGPLPWKTLHVVESNYLERDEIPGIVFISHPPQHGLANLQFHQTKWALWTLSMRLARQWWGGMAISSSYDSDWLNLGNSDWLAEQALSQLSGSNALELFNEGLDFLSLTHSQYLNMIAATLNRQDPHSFLYDARDKGSVSADLQAPTLYIKHTFAMRYLTAQLGEPQLHDLLRSFLLEHANQTITSKGFLAHFDHETTEVPAKELQVAKDGLAKYWLTSGFPDFSLEHWNSHPIKTDESGSSQWETSLSFHVDNHNGLKIPIRLIDKEKNQIHLMVDPMDANPGASYDQTITGLISGAKIEKIIIDPDYIFFDPDRFDNTSAFPTVNFFPGNFQTLSDHHYSVFWLPYFFRRPGEPFSFGAGFSMMKYTRPLLFGSLEYAPSGKATAYNLSSQQKPPILRGMEAEIRFSKDYENAQSAALIINQTPLSQALPLMSANLSLAHHRQLGAPESAHFVSGLGLTLDSKKLLGSCGVSLAVLQNFSPKISDQEFSYQKTQAQLSSECQFLKNFAFRSKQTYGVLRGHGPLPETVAFKINDLQGAGHRIDIPDLPRLQDIFSTTQDLYAPIPFLEGNSGFLLLNRLKLRAFYDLALSPKASHSLYRASGTGLTLPFGGAITGVGDLAILRFSALAVLYAATPDEIKRKPSFLFDFSGDL